MRTYAGPSRVPVSTANDTARTFRHCPGVTWYAMLLALGAVGALIALLLDRRTRSLAGVVFVVVVAFAIACLAGLSAAMWRSHWRLTVSREHLVAYDWMTRNQVVIPWDSVVSVRAVPRRWWWNWPTGMALNEIVTVKGDRIPFGTHLLEYREFLELLRQYAPSCRTFAPHPTGIFEWPRG
jgi:hypothetical protein